jgi:hypothetical protein
MIADDRMEAAMAKPLIAALFLIASSLCSAAAADAVPESGAVRDGAYENPYFGFTLKLPPGWASGPEGPRPSLSGYYVLANLLAAGPEHGSLLVAAQDLFFGDKPFADAAGMTDSLRAGLRDIADLQIDPAARAVEIGGRHFHRLDYDAGGLYRSWLATDLRCHVVLFTVTASAPETRAKLVEQLDTLSFTVPTAPACHEDYATAQTVLHKVEPPEIKPKGLRIPARIVIDAEGSVQQVHVLRAAPALRDDIAAALMQWRFRPYAPEGRAIALETGLMIGDAPRTP